MKPFYLTTAITYASAHPHVGNIYEIVLADAIVRYKKLQGYDTFFSTGMDEHGLKIETNANALGRHPFEYVTELATVMKNILKEINVDYDYFCRTTDPKHVRIAEEIFKKLYDTGNIYLGEYEGPYCKACESYYTEKQLKDGKCPDCGGIVSIEKEEAYFFKLEKYQEALIRHIHENPKFIEPESRKNEMLNNFLKEPLPDLCVSRTTFSWGIKVPFNQKHVIYVWIDALANYLSNIDYEVTGKQSAKFQKFWPASLHLIGKDILRFHTIYWPIMLMALELPLPKQIFGHPWIITPTGKMSKSKFNTIYTEDLIKEYGVDVIRYYLLHEIPFATDGILSHELIMERNNSDLANTLGNLVSRTIAMQKKYFPEGVNQHGIITDVDRDLVDLCYHSKTKCDTFIDEYKVSDAIEQIMLIFRRANKYIDENEPWNLAKDESKKIILENVLYNILETIRFGSVLLQAFLPETSEKIFSILNTNAKDYRSILSFGAQKHYLCNDTNPLFNRYDIAKKIASFKEVEQKVNLIEQTDIEKLEMVIGEILEINTHPYVDNLNILKVNLGSEIRQIVVSKKDDEWIGKKVIVVKNMKETEISNVKSKGIILATKNTLEIANAEVGEIIK